jgi:hypothetical protein
MDPRDQHVADPDTVAYCDWSVGPVLGDGISASSGRLEIPTRLCRRFIENLTKRPTQWPEHTLKQFGAECSIDRAHLGAWIDIRLIATRADAVARLAYYPFIVLFVLLLARLNYFDNLKMTMALFVIYAVFFVYTLYSTLALHHTAISARDTLVSRLEDELIRVKRRGGATRG